MKSSNGKCVKCCATEEGKHMRCVCGCEDIVQVPHEGIGTIEICQDCGKTTLLLNGD